MPTKPTAERNPPWAIFSVSLAVSMVQTLSDSLDLPNLVLYATVVDLRFRCFARCNSLVYSLCLMPRCDGAGCVPDRNDMLPNRLDEDMDTGKLDSFRWHGCFCFD
jgi:hypothetical protein